MCKETFHVLGLDNQRSAYEVEEFLTGVPDVQTARADFLKDEIVVEYDETQLAEDALLDMIEHAGCEPEDRLNSVFGKLKVRLSKI